MRTNKLLALLSAVLAVFIIIGPLQAQNTTQPDSPQVLIDKGMQAFQNHNYEQASILFRQARRADNETKKLSADQRNQLDRMLDESAKGATKYRVAETSLAQGKKDLANDNFIDARKQFNKVLASENYVPVSWIQEAKVQLGVVAEKSKKSDGLKAQTVKAVVKPAEDKPVVTLTAKPATQPATICPKSQVEPKVCGVEGQKAVAKECAPAANTPAQPTMLDEILAARNVQRQQVLASFHEGERQIRQAVLEHRFLPARDTLRQARQDVLRSRMLFSQEEMERLLLQVDSIAKFIDSEEQAYQQQQSLLQSKEAEQKRLTREEQVQQEKFDKIQKLFGEAIQLRREKKYKEAIVKAKEILEIEPNFDRAKWFIDDIEDLADYTVQRKITNNIDVQGRKSLNDSDKSRIPWVEEIQYPKNWQELAKYRDELIRKTGRTGAGDTPARITEKLILATYLENTNGLQGSLRNAISYLQTKGINILVRWDVLEQEGVSPDDEVKFESIKGLKNISMRALLDVLVSTMGPPEVGINYAIDTNGFLVISTKDDLTTSKLTPRIGRLETRMYNISDLMLYRPSVSAIPEVEPEQEKTTIKDQELKSKDFEDLVTIEDLSDYMKTLIQSVVAPTTWVEAGGEGSIDIWRYRWLIIYQTPEIHDQIATLLDSLREVQSVQIALEARFITISSNFLEKVGLDLDVIFNQGNAGYDFTGTTNNFGNTKGGTTSIVQPREFSYLGALPASPSGTTALPAGYQQPYGSAGLVPQRTGGTNNWTPIPVINSSNEMVSPQDTSLPGNLANSFSKPAFQVMGSFLDDLQVNFLLEATQMDKYSNIVQAPRIVMENGSLGYISVMSDIPYVEDIQVTVGEQAAGQEPTVEFMGFGTVLAVQAVTRDLKYVNMYVVPQITQRDASADLNISVPIVAPGSVGSTNYTYPGKKTTRVETIVSVPDGGTLLIGGLKQSGEVTMEAGPPMLDKMPVVKRFFANNAKTRDNYTLMVLVKPKILVREEIDPDLSNKLNIGPTPAASESSY